MFYSLCSIAVFLQLLLFEGVYCHLWSWRWRNFPTASGARSTERIHPSVPLCKTTMVSPCCEHVCYIRRWLHGV